VTPFPSFSSASSPTFFSSFFFTPLANGLLLHPLVDDLPCSILQYADDTLIIIQAITQHVANLKAALDVFSKADTVSRSARRVDESHSVAASHTAARGSSHRTPVDGGRWSISTWRSNLCLGWATRRLLAEKVSPSGIGVSIAPARSRRSRRPADTLSRSARRVEDESHSVSASHSVARGSSHRTAVTVVAGAISTWRSNLWLGDAARLLVEKVWRSPEYFTRLSWTHVALPCQLQVFDSAALLLPLWKILLLL
jgi:hypothetical protein